MVAEECWKILKKNFKSKIYYESFLFIYIEKCFKNF